MKEIIKIAWRNLWRNKKRTIITASSIFFAIFFAIIMRSFQLGTYDHMIRQTIESFSGYLQVQQVEYQDDPSLDHSMEVDTNLYKLINNDPNIKAAVPRVESFALASTGLLSKGVIVMGIDPEKERALSNPSHNLVRYKLTPAVIDNLKQTGNLSAKLVEVIKKMENTSFASLETLMADLGLNKKDTSTIKLIASKAAFGGRYLDQTDDGILLSDRLADYLNASLGDSVVLMGQGYHGMSAAGIYPIRGIVKMPAPDIDNKLVYMTLSKANSLFSLEGKLTSIAINLYNTQEMKRTQSRLMAELKNTDVSIKNWEELNPTLKQQIQGDNKSGQVFLLVLYVIIFFGIFGTVQMMISERSKEFGMMVSIGMKRGKLAIILTVEMLFLGLLGALSGMLASVPLILWGFYHPFKVSGEMARMYMDYGFDPIMPLAWFGPYFYLQGGVIFVMVVLATYLPVKSILKLNPIKALHGE